MAKALKAQFLALIILLPLAAVTCGSAAASMLAPALMETPKSSAATVGLTGAPRPTATARSQPAATPASVQQYGGNLRMSAYDGVHGWDPKEFSSSSIQVVGQLYNQIVQYDTRDTGRVVCDLCESWEVSDEGKTFTFHIRPGIKWLDGQDLNAEDVHHSMLRYGDLTYSAGLPGYWRNYTLVAKNGGVNHIDSHSVEFNLPSFSGAFIKSLALDYVKVLPKHLLEQGINLNLPQNVMAYQSGSGPFMLESYRERERYKVSKNQGYFKEGRPYLNSIEHFIINETSTLIAVLLVGQIDMSSGLHRLPPSYASQVESDPHSAIRAVPMLYGDNGLLLNVKKEQFNDPRVRKAIALAIDYQDWNRQIFDDNSRVGCPLLGLAHSFEECEAWPGTRSKDTPEGQADLMEAKRLMAEAGYPDGFESKCAVTPALRTSIAQCDVLQGQLKNSLGIVGSIRAYDYPAYRQLLNTSRPAGQEGDWEMTCRGHGGAVADVDYIMSLIHQKDGSLNFTNWENDQVNTLFEQQRVETDPAKRREINKQLELFLADQSHWISLGQNVSLRMIGEQIQSFHAPQTLYSHYKHEDLWLGNVITAPPGVTVSYVGMDPAARVRIGTAIPVIATFTEPVTGFTVDDITVGNGTAGNISGSGASYTFDVTPNAIGQVTVDIAADVTTDADDNGNTAAMQLPLGIPYNDNRSGTIEKSEVVAAINDYLFGDGSLEKSHVVAVINLYLFG